MSRVRPQKIHGAMMNSQQEVFAMATENGTRVFNSNPLALMNCLDREQVGNIKIASILHRSNLLLFVGYGKNSKYPCNTVMVYNMAEKELQLEVTVTGGPIVNILASMSRLVVIQEKRLLIFTFPDPCKMIRGEEIRLNPMGLAALSMESNSQMLAYPGFKIGSVQLLNLNTLTEKSSACPCVIDAHLTQIVQLAINNQGTLVATGSTKGTVIRVFDTRTQRALMECRRGSDPATLHTLQFSPCSSYLAVSSDKGTVHIFAIRESDEAAGKMSLLHQVGLARKERRSCAQVSIPSRVITLGFLRGTTTTVQSIVAVCEDGTYHRFIFNTDGNVVREGYDMLMQLAEEQDFWTRPV